MVGFIILGIAVGIQVLIWMPKYFIRKNNRGASQAAFEEYVREMNKFDKSYMPHIKQLSEKLNAVNYWIKSGNDPEELLALQSEENKGKVLSPSEITRWTPSDGSTLGDNEIVKAMRNNEFFVDGLEENEFGQSEMKFYYTSDYIECIYYCVTPEALEKKFFKNVIYFTTARPTQIPMVYPNKYEGAQMLSLYKHPCQAIWFLRNWKKIKNELEIKEEQLPEIEQSSLDEFDL